MSASLRKLSSIVVVSFTHPDERLVEPVLRALAAEAGAKLPSGGSLAGVEGISVVQEPSIPALARIGIAELIGIR